MWTIKGWRSLSSLFIYGLVSFLLAFSFSSSNSSLVLAMAELQVEQIYVPPNAASLLKARAGHRVKMHYTGTLLNGKTFDSSRDRNDPFVFTLGTGSVIPGWDAGIPGMVVGEKRKLVIPSHLAYGDRGFGEVIPPRSTLVFDVELIDIVNKQEL